VSCTLTGQLDLVVSLAVQESESTEEVVYKEDVLKISFEQLVVKENYA